jgi:hypothetical protein
MKSTVFAYDVTGDQTALWVEVNPANYKNVYPADGPQPAPGNGGAIVKVSFAHTPAPYTPPNRFLFNTFTDAIAGCKSGPAVLDDHLFAAPMTWHQMAAEAPSGPNVRLAMGGYQLINMNNTVNPARGRGTR